MQFCYFNINNLYFIYLSVSCDIKSALLLSQRYITGEKFSVTLGAKSQALTGMCTSINRKHQNISDFTMNQLKPSIVFLSSANSMWEKHHKQTTTNPTVALISPHPEHVLDWTCGGALWLPNQILLIGEYFVSAA